MCVCVCVRDAALRPRTSSHNATHKSTRSSAAVVRKGDVGVDDDDDDDDDDDTAVVMAVVGVVTSFRSVPVGASDGEEDAGPRDAAAGVGVGRAFVSAD